MMFPYHRFALIVLFVLSLMDIGVGLWFLQHSRTSPGDWMCISGITGVLLISYYMWKYENIDENIMILPLLGGLTNIFAFLELVSGAFYPYFVPKHFLVYLYLSIAFKVITTPLLFFQDSKHEYIEI